MLIITHTLTQGSVTCCDGKTCSIVTHRLVLSHCSVLPFNFFSDLRGRIHKKYLCSMFRQKSFQVLPATKICLNSQIIFNKIINFKSNIKMRNMFYYALLCYYKRIKVHPVVTVDYIYTWWRMECEWRGRRGRARGGPGCRPAWCSRRSHTGTDPSGYCTAKNNQLSVSVNFCFHWYVCPLTW